MQRSLGDRIRDEREAKGWSQSDLGRILGVAPATVHRYEVNERRPDPEMLSKLADLFVVTVDYLLGRTDTEEPSDIRVILRASKQLTEEERQSVLDFIEFTRAQRRKRGEKLPEEASRVDDRGPKDGGRGAP